MTSERPLLPLLAVGTTLVLWASAFVAIRHLGHDFSAGPLTLARQGPAAAYSADEVEYPASAVKEPNPEYESG